MKITYENHMGDDLMVVNSARVSFNKKHEKFQEDKDEKLIKYLAEHGHWTPFSHPQLQVHVKAPIFVARQLDKHQVGMTRNEVSRRYVDYEPEFYEPSAWRSKPVDKKQGSGDEITKAIWGTVAYISAIERAKEAYNQLLRDGVCPEQARMILPLSMYTEWYWTGSLYAFTRIINLRCKPDAQKETRDLIYQLVPIVKELWPISSKYLIGEVE